MKKNKGISLIILVLLIVVILVIGVVSIFLITKNNNNSSNTNNQENMNTQDVENIENIEENLGLLTKSSLSLYNPQVKSSNYLSMIVYDPQKTRLSSGDKEILEDAIVVVTEFDKDIYSDFFKDYYKSIVNNNNFVYRYSLGTDKKVVK